MLFETERHESLRESAWDETRARDSIKRIVAEAELAFDPVSLWPAHPLDGRASVSLYMGAAGVVWAIDHLAEQGVVQKQREWGAIVESLFARRTSPSAAHPEARRGFGFGEAGIALIGYRLTRSGIWIERMVEAARENQDHDSNELLIGAPGTLLAAAALADESGDTRLRGIVQESADRVLSKLHFESEHGCALWTQLYFAPPVKMIGLAHGFAGVACALLRAGRERPLASEFERTLAATAQCEDGFANWPQSVGAPRPGRTSPLVQICHGAPGVIVGLSQLEPRSGSRLEELLLEGGELTWRAGPLAKGSNLCHGTAGNGYAFLCLYRRTGKRVWLERARAFAMHAMLQWESERAHFGRGRFSLWTGDAGLACFLWDCIRERAEFPTLHAF